MYEIDYLEEALSLKETRVFFNNNLGRTSGGDAVISGRGGKHGMDAMSNPLKEAWKGGGEGLEVHLDDPKGDKLECWPVNLNCEFILRWASGR